MPRARHIRRRSTGRYTRVPSDRSHAPRLRRATSCSRPRERFASPTPSATIDVGYRGRPLPAVHGPRRARRSARSASASASSPPGPGLRLDIEGGEADRLYGDAWYRFIADCRAMLGVESGVSCIRPRGRGASPSTASSRRAGREPTIDDLRTARWAAGTATSTSGRSARATSRRPRSASARCCSRADYAGVDGADGATTSRCARTSRTSTRSSRAIRDPDVRRELPTTRTAT